MCTPMLPEGKSPRPLKIGLGASLINSNEGRFSLRTERTSSTLFVVSPLVAPHVPRRPSTSVDDPIPLISNGIVGQHDLGVQTILVASNTLFWIE